jgi:hypothetical protein
MSWFGVWSLTWWAGNIVFMSLGFVAITRWFLFTREMWQRGTWFLSPALVMEYLSGPAGKVVPLSTRWVVTAMWTGGLLSMISVGIGGSQANTPCVAACKADGWSSGRLRGDPHAPPGGPYVYECWCNRGAEWSDTSIVP